MKWILTLQNVLNVAERTILLLVAEIIEFVKNVIKMKGGGSRAARFEEIK